MLSIILKSFVFCSGAKKWRAIYSPDVPTENVKCLHSSSRAFYWKNTPSNIWPFHILLWHSKCKWRVFGGVRYFLSKPIFPNEIVEFTCSSSDSICLNLNTSRKFWCLGFMKIIFISRKSATQKSGISLSRLWSHLRVVFFPHQSKHVGGYVFFTQVQRTAFFSFFLLLTPASFMSCLFFVTWIPNIFKLQPWNEAFHRFKKKYQSLLGMLEFFSSHCSFWCYPQHSISASNSLKSPQFS